jgi:hypothetical protein
MINGNAIKSMREKEREIEEEMTKIEQIIINK